MGQDASDVAARFINEARSAAGCTHPNVVTVFDYGRKLETAYIVMERLPGPDLQTLVARGDRLPIDQALEYTEQALKGLGAAHDVDLMHRDIKPANLVLSKDGTVKIVDFGIAKFTQSSTVSGQLSGTIGYMAPERFEGGDASRQGDLYSLGCTMVTLLTGQPPFSGSPEEIMKGHLSGDRQPPSSRRWDVPAALDDLVLRLLSMNPQDRPTDARIVVVSLIVV